MLLWINGPFGGGKTQTAHELQRRLPGSVLCDPEPQFTEHVWTDHLTIHQVADRIAASAGLTLAPNTDGPLRARLRRAWTGIRHIRFD
ncbi:hypothetical protein ACO0M4_14735 [Streptomyces sp. RGM 3693]|uniref:hypothetical protein n=1 Tax=Streptomyces sp. RGM 3693 TaxID=3413284 RepID=UPI003D2C5354